ncbi:MAG TPA: response regulator transcription factor [Terriglobales bacterium]|nr:response regulator transcription factor [Terriglobales bacterium]
MSAPVSVGDIGRPREGGDEEQFIRVIVADTQAIFRAGLRKIFAVEDDIRVIGQAETISQTMAAAKKFSGDILIFEAALAENPVEAVSELLRQSPSLRLVVLTAEANEELTLELFRRGAHGIVSREIEPELLLDCIRKVATGEPWLDARGIHWVMEAYRTQGTRPAGSRSKVQLTPKESLIVSCVTQGMKNKEIASRVGTTEQVVKNYLRKVYDKLGVADRLELALYCLNNRVEGVGRATLAAAAPPAPASGNGTPAVAAAAAAGAGAGSSSVVIVNPPNSTEKI